MSLFSVFDDPNEMFYRKARDSVDLSRFPEIQYKPLTGGVFSIGRFGMWSGLIGGKENVLIVSLEMGAPIAAGYSKADAISSAREFLTRLGEDYPIFIKKVLEQIPRVEHAKRFAERQRGEFKARLTENVSANKQMDEEIPRPIPKRRLEIFNKSHGECHYCHAPLDLRGRWHIEHMMPRALLGSNKRSNLVASCVTCNMKKKDKTAEEFIAERAAEAQTETA